MDEVDEKQPLLGTQTSVSIEKDRYTGSGTHKM